MSHEAINELITQNKQFGIGVLALTLNELIYEAYENPSKFNALRSFIKQYDPNPITEAYTECAEKDNSPSEYYNFKPSDVLVLIEGIKNGEIDRHDIFKASYESLVDQQAPQDNFVDNNDLLLTKEELEWLASEEKNPDKLEWKSLKQQPESDEALAWELQEQLDQADLEEALALSLKEDELQKDVANNKKFVKKDQQNSSNPKPSQYDILLEDKNAQPAFKTEREEIDHFKKSLIVRLKEIFEGNTSETVKTASFAIEAADLCGKLSTNKDNITLKALKEFFSEYDSVNSEISYQEIIIQSLDHITFQTHLDNSKLNKKKCETLINLLVEEDLGTFELLREGVLQPQNPLEDRMVDECLSPQTKAKIQARVKELNKIKLLSLRMVDENSNGSKSAKEHWANKPSTISSKKDVQAPVLINNDDADDAEFNKQMQVAITNSLQFQADAKPYILDTNTESLLGKDAQKSVIADGNCFWRGLANSTKGDQNKYNEVKEAALKYAQLQIPAGEFLFAFESLTIADGPIKKPYISTGDNRSEEQKKIVIEYYSGNNIYADEAMIAFASKALGVNIVIFSEGGINVFLPAERSQKTCALYHHKEIPGKGPIPTRAPHYDGLELDSKVHNIILQQTKELYKDEKIIPNQGSMNFIKWQEVAQLVQVEGVDDGLNQNNAYENQHDNNSYYHEATKMAGDIYKKLYDVIKIY